jgi:hypothetical protein
MPVTQEARDKPRKVCQLNLRGEVCTATNCGNKHPKVCLEANHSKGKIPKATCSLWHMRIPFAGNAGNATGRRNGSNHPSGNKGSKAKTLVALRPVKPDAKLAKLTSTAMAEELKARIRMAKLMLQGVSYSQMVQAHAPAPTSAPALAPALAPAPAPAPAPASDPTSVAPRTARNALTPDEAVRILLDVVDRLQR